MKIGRYLLALGVVLALSGILLAISGATPTAGLKTRWTGASAGSIVTQGGNITAVNVAMTELTSKWAEFSGNVTGTIVLGDGSANVYSWTWATTQGGEVCVSTGSAYDFTTAAAISDATTVDTAWSFGSAADNATNTYTLATCSLALYSGTITNTARANLAGSSTFYSCAIKNSGVAKANHAFCTAIQATGTGKNYANTNANYEVLAPTATSGTETYYFYAELS